MNSAILIGTLIEKPELRYMNDGQTAICSSYIEFVERTKEKTISRLAVKAWGKMADELHKYAVGNKVLLRGGLRMDTVEHPAGFKQKVAEFNVSEIIPFEAQIVQATATSTSPEEDDDCPFD